MNLEVIKKLDCEILKHEIIKQLMLHKTAISYYLFLHPRAQRSILGCRPNRHSNELHGGEINGKHLLFNWPTITSALRKHPRTGDDLTSLIWVRLLLTRPSRLIAQLNAAQFAQHVRRTTKGSLRGSTAAANSTNLRLRRPRPPQGRRSQRVLQRTSS